MVAVEVSPPDPQLPDQGATGERIVHEPVPCDGFRIKVGILQCTIGGTRAMAGHRITIKLMNFQCKRDISAMQPLDPSSLAGTPGTAMQHGAVARSPTGWRGERSSGHLLIEAGWAQRPLRFAAPPFGEALSRRFCAGRIAPSPLRNSCGLSKRLAAGASGSPFVANPQPCLHLPHVRSRLLAGRVARRR